MADSKAEWKKMWDGMSLESLRSHAAWVWYDYTHAGNIRHAPPTRDYAEAVRAEWRRRERNAEQPAEPAGTHGDRRGQRQGRAGGEKCHPGDTSRKRCEIE